MRRDLAVVAFLLAPGAARADGWLVVEAPAAIAVSDAQAGVFRPGIMPAVGAYAEHDRFALGARLRSGILRNGPAPGENLADPGIGGLTTAGLALRMSALGGWVELVGGGGITGRDVVPAIEAGLGWSMAAGSLDIGPSARYVRVVSRETMAAFGTAELALVGVDVRFGKRRPARIAAVARQEPAVIQTVVGPVQADDDRVVDGETSCANELDGCPLGEQIVIQNDRIVLDERVLFDFNRARVKSSGRTVIAALAKIWHEHPDWQHITVEGHADARGTDEYNQQLSQLRAERVREVMVQLGCDGDAISSIGYGRSRVRDPGTTEQAHQRNRRVEFVIDRGGDQ